MLRHRRTGPPRWAAVAVALAVAGAGLVVAATPAYAEPFPFSEGFEGSPNDRWIPVVVPGQTSVRLGNDARARTPTKVASLNAGPLVPSTAGIYRTVTPDITQPIPSSCQVQLWARRVPNVPGPDPQSVEMQFKLRSGGPNGQITLSRGTSIYRTDGWEAWNVGTFWYPSSTFTIEITAYHGRALLDDLFFQCIGFH
ncbi:hypothetical protein ACTMTJ_08395 [Phytohabitans sp. LJ34]|uniref:hypothetical protein n=1 Tax=Phytohabitans sp. LJ34 TaxID=3452217 RepID=UPI003F8A1408